MSSAAHSLHAPSSRWLPFPFEPHPRQARRLKKIAQVLFGFRRQRNTLQTLPDGFDVRWLPLSATYTEAEYVPIIVLRRCIHRPFRYPRPFALSAASISDSAGTTP